MTTRLAIIGAGFMARRRAQAFLKTGHVTLCGVASRHEITARTFAEEIGINYYCNDYHKLLEVKPDAILVEVPHSIQDEIVAWALSQNLHVFIGGPLSATSQQGQVILETAQQRHLIVEAGFEARYKAVWEKAREILHRGDIGKPIALRTIALWPAKLDSWYYRESLSGGMPLTHLSYAFLNPVRWLLGEPTYISAFANQIYNQTPDSVREETCIANLVFNNDIIATMMAGYVHSANTESWMLSFHGTQGVLEIYPTEMDNGWLRVVQGDNETKQDFSDSQDAFILQAEAFLASLNGENRCRNRPCDTLGDLIAIEAIVTSAREHRTINL